MDPELELKFLFFLLLTIADLSAALIIFFGALSERMRLYPTWHKIGLITACAGLAAQGYRNVYYLMTGISPSDVELPLWVLKDLGICIIAFTYFTIGVRVYMRSINRPKVTVAKKTAKTEPKPAAARKKTAKKVAKKTTKKVKSTQ